MSETIENDASAVAAEIKSDVNDDGAAAFAVSNDDVVVANDDEIVEVSDGENGVCETPSETKPETKTKVLLCETKTIARVQVCRVCLAPRPCVNLFSRRPSIGSYAELLTSITNLEVSCNDGITEKICTKCANFLDNIYRFKKVAEASNVKLRSNLIPVIVKPQHKERTLRKMKSNPTKKIILDGSNDMKHLIDFLKVKQEPKLQVEIEVLGEHALVDKPPDIDGKDIQVCNTTIRKVNHSTNAVQNSVIPTFDPNDLLQVKKAEPCDDDDNDPDFNIGDFGGGDFDSDDDYVPLASCKKKKLKEKFKIRKKTTMNIPQDGKGRMPQKQPPKKLGRRLKILNMYDLKKEIPGFKREASENMENMPENANSEGRSNRFITCYPIRKDGARGPPVVLKRPKDSTILKTDPNYKPRPYNRRSKEMHHIALARQATIKQREKHVCPICGVLTFALGTHMATHSEKKRYNCPQCSRSFAQKNNMLVHLKAHSGLKDHICEVCGSGFYCQKSLLRHKLIHKGDRPFACTLCPKRFIARCDLTRHLKIHSGYKPYKCADCTMSFNAKHQLQNHERMHTGEKPFSCQVCNVAFSYKVNLNNHVYKVHGINLKFKSIHTITEEVLRKEQELLPEPKNSLVLPDGDPRMSNIETITTEDWKIPG